MPGHGHSALVAAPMPGIRVLIFLFSGAILWFAHLLIVYGVEIGLCGEAPGDIRGDPGSWIRPSSSP